MNVRLVGVGGAGNNVVHRFHKLHAPRGARTLAVNTDKVHLDIIEADDKLMVGALTRGLGAGGRADIGEQAMAHATSALVAHLGGADVVLIAAGMGGGTGSGGAPVVARAAKVASGAFVVAFATAPFKVERSRGTTAEGALSTLRKAADTVVVLEHDRLLDRAPHLAIDTAFAIMDKIIAEGARGLALGFADAADIPFEAPEDALAVLRTPGQNLLGYGRGRSVDAAVQDAFTRLLGAGEPRRAKGAIVLLRSPFEARVSDAEHAAKLVAAELDAGASVVWSAHRDATDGTTTVHLLFTGLP